MASTLYIDIGIESVRIENTRSKHEDTDHIELCFQVGSAIPQLQYKFLGNLNSGTHAISARALSWPVNPGDVLLLNYMMVNSSVTPPAPASVQAYLEGITLEWINAKNPPPLNFTSQVAALYEACRTGIAPIFNPASCDGMVAAEFDSFTYDQIAEMTAGAIFTYTTHHPGIHSNSGCGPNSQYDVTWTLTRDTKLQ